MKTVRAFARSVRAEGIRIEKVILFGSHARNAAGEDSDIDVAVISPDFGRDRSREDMRLFRIAGKVDPHIEPIPISKKSYEKDTWLPLIYEIREHGVTVKRA
jgi:predicted nucleotidyltransferase